MAILNLRGRYFKFYPTGNPLGYAEENIEIDTARTAFLLVDVYGPYFSERGLTSSQQTDKLLEEAHLSTKEFEYKNEVVLNHIKPALDAARKIGLNIVYVSNSSPRVALYRSEFGKMLKKAEDMDIEKVFSEDCVDPKEYVYGNSKHLTFSEIIAPRSSDFFIRKHTFSGFFDTRLDTLLRNLKIENLICVGFKIDVCLLSTMLDALYRNYKVILIRDCTLACELPEEIDDLNFTSRMIKWVECFIGPTITSKDFVKIISTHLTK